MFTNHLDAVHTEMASSPATMSALEQALRAVMTKAKMTPAKVYLGGQGEPDLSHPKPVAPASFMSPTQDLWNMAAPSPSNSGEWVKAVLQTAPFLNQSGINQAINILDLALNNVQRAKALESIRATSHQLPLPATSAATTELMLAEVYRQQQTLLCQLHLLQATAKATPIPPSIGPDFLQDQCAARVAAVAAESFMNDATVRQLLINALLAPQVAPVPPSQVIQPDIPVFERGFVTERRPQKAPRQPKAVLQTLSTSLQLLADEDPNNLLIVRRINKLGFKASGKLKHYFQKFGTVIKVLVAHSTCRQTGEVPCQARRRPSSLGFIHMASAAAVREVLALGEEQEVDGAFIRVQKFERQHAQNVEDDGDEDSTNRSDKHIVTQDDFGLYVSGRQQSASASSNASTTTGGSSAERGAGGSRSSSSPRRC